MPALISAVWWITIVDAALVRHHAKTYNAVMADQTPAGRPMIEGTLQDCASSGTGSATTSILLSSSNRAHPVRRRRGACHGLDLDVSAGTGARRAVQDRDSTFRGTKASKNRGCGAELLRLIGDSAVVGRVEPPRRVRRLQLLRRRAWGHVHVMGATTRASCGSGRCGWSPR